MPRKPAPVPYTTQLALERLAAAGKDTVVDWDAQLDVELPAILQALVGADAGIMFRSADQRRAISVGVFAGGAPVWQTCRDQTELSDFLRRVLVTLEEVAGDVVAPEPTRKGRQAAREGSSSA